MTFLIFAVPIALIVAVLLADIRDYQHTRYMNRNSCKRIRKR